MSNTAPYFFRLPRPKELVAELKDCRKAKHRLAIITACKNDNQRLRTFLDNLKSQTYQDFDVIIIYGEDDPFLPENGLSILHVRRRKDLGFAGGLFLGQLIAYFEGYELFSMFDVDRLFAEPTSLELLISQLKGVEVSAGRSWDMHDDLPHCAALVLGSVIRRSVLKKAGFYYAPLFAGFDDLDYTCRLLSAGVKVRYTEKTITIHKANEAPKPCLPYGLQIVFYRGMERIWPSRPWITRGAKTVFGWLYSLFFRLGLAELYHPDLPYLRFKNHLARLIYDQSVGRYLDLAGIYGFWVSSAFVSLPEVLRLFLKGLFSFPSWRVDILKAEKKGRIIWSLATCLKNMLVDFLAVWRLFFTGRAKLNRTGWLLDVKLKERPPLALWFLMPLAAFFAYAFPHFFMPEPFRFAPRPEDLYSFKNVCALKNEWKAVSEGKLKV